MSSNILLLSKSILARKYLFKHSPRHQSCQKQRLAPYSTQISFGIFCDSCSYREFFFFGKKERKKKGLYTYAHSVLYVAEGFYVVDALVGELMDTIGFWVLFLLAGIHILILNKQSCYQIFQYLLRPMIFYFLLFIFPWSWLSWPSSIMFFMIFFSDGYS